MLKGKIKSVAAGTVAAAFIIVAPTATMAKADSHSDSNAHNKITICHATGSQSNPFVKITPDANGVVNGHESHQDANDIIPPFDYNDHGTTKHFAGQNWDANGQAIFDNGCKVAGGEGGGPQKDCDNDFDNSAASECVTPTPGGQMDCDGDTDSSPATDCPSGGLGGGTTTTQNNGQVLAATTANGQTATQQVQSPSGGVGAGFGGASVKSNPAAIFGLGGSLLSLGTGLALLNRRENL